MSSTLETTDLNTSANREWSDWKEWQEWKAWKARHGLEEDEDQQRSQAPHSVITNYSSPKCS